MIMALTKAEMADKLFDQLGLNKREAKERNIPSNNNNDNNNKHYNNK